MMGSYVKVLNGIVVESIKADPDDGQSYTWDEATTSWVLYSN
jgi:hypothetical protein